MKDKVKKVQYIKPSSTHGEGKVKIGETGTIIKHIQNPQTNKLLINFEYAGMVVVPQSTIKFID